MNKKGQAYIAPYGIIDASTLPRWILYPLMILIVIILLVTVVLLCVFTISMLKGDVNYIPIGYGLFRGFGMPIYVASWGTSSQTCTMNGEPISCAQELNRSLPR